MRLNALVSPNVALLFQLTHSRGVRHDLAKSATDLENFNSRTHVECDGSTATKNGSSWNFNSRTHVECDISVIRMLSFLHDFNSRTHVECDQTNIGAGKRATSFQLTHSRGVRPIENGGCLVASNFNSRTHVECDLIAFSFFRLYAGFQLTHSRGVRPFGICPGV